jgi:hypothetical protein
MAVDEVQEIDNHILRVAGVEREPGRIIGAEVDVRKWVRANGAESAVPVLLTFR